MAATASRRGALISTSPQGYPLIATPDGTSVYFAGCLGYVSATNVAKTVNDSTPDSEIVGVFKAEYDSTDADNTDTTIELWTGVAVILNQDATNPLAYAGQDVYILDNDTVDDGTVGTVKIGTAMEIDPLGSGSDTVKVFIQPTS